MDRFDLNSTSPTEAQGCTTPPSSNSLEPTKHAGEERKPERSIPWVHLGNSDTPSNRLPEVFTQSVSSSERAKLRFTVRGNAILTGGAGALALKSARALLEHGLSGLALLDLPAAFQNPDVSEAVQALRTDFPSCTIVCSAIDVTDAEGVQRVVGEIRSRLGPLSILCCFAGIVNCVFAEDMPADQWRKVLDVNTTGTWLVTQAVGKHMISDSNGGRIVLISSISAHRVNYPQPQAAYNVSKAGILQLRASLAAEWSRYGIRVNSISPGYMDTALNEGDALAPFRQIWADRNPMGRMGDPQEMTGPVVFLCSEVAGSYVNGADIVVDGGGLVF
ncbi:gluconate 5-dehydrogenase [[Emmonsia] crescens]|uniref:D-arabinitol 2-dehydrogenase [ribulose-forming] n=1 Tax=[Emmonsia] crescens TaxID=73230 RepID=A0A0G2J941_9EURO|nr:gluconate 5-dehydrogenase [Emmonsia crescens UAMH 3008]